MLASLLRGRCWVILLVVSVLLAKPGRSATDEPVVASEDRNFVTGAVLDENGRPAAGVTIHYLSGVDRERLKSDDKGRFTVTLKDGPFRWGLLHAESGGADHQGIVDLSTTKPGEPVSLKLKPARETTVRVQDAQGKPVADAQVAAMASLLALCNGQTDGSGQVLLRIPVDAKVEQVFAFKPGVGFDYVSTLKAPQSADRDPLPAEVNLKLTGARSLTIKALDSAGKPVAGFDVYPWYLRTSGKTEDVNLSGALELVSRRTDAAGLVTFDWIPEDFENAIAFMVRSEEFSAPERAVLFAEKPVGELTLSLLRRAKLAGRVLHTDGKPADGIVVSANGTGATVDGGYDRVTTKEDGSYEMMLPTQQAYVIAVDDKQWAAPTQAGIVLHENQPVENIDFRLVPATTVRGQVTVGENRKPVPGVWISLTHRAGEIPAELKRAGDNSYHEMSYSRGGQTDEQGNFEIHVGPGAFEIRGPAHTEIAKITIDQQHEIVHDFHMPRPATARLTGKVVDSEGQPVPEANVSCVYMAPFGGREPEAVTSAEGMFEVERSTVPAAFYARSADGSQAGVARIGDEDAAVTITIGPLASVTGRLLDEDGQPLPDTKVSSGTKIYQGKPGKSPFQWSFGPSVKTGAEGKYELRGLLPGELYDITYYHEGENRYSNLAAVTLKPLEHLDVGDTKLSKPYMPPTLAEKTAKLFEKREPFAERLNRAKSFAQRGYTRVLILIGDEKTPAGEKLAELRGEAWRRLLDEYEQIPVSAEDEASIESIRTMYGAPVAELKAPALVALDDQGKLLGVKQLVLTGESAEQESTEAVAFLKQHALPQLDAEQLLADALAKAGRENKRVFVQQTATWCPPCKRLTTFIYEHKPAFDENYVYLKIDDSRFLHGEEVVKRLRKERSGGIPWVVILAADGQELGTSNDPDGENYGYPGGSEVHTQLFLKLLADTAPRMTPEQLETFGKSLAAKP